MWSADCVCYQRYGLDVRGGHGRATRRTRSSSRWHRPRGAKRHPDPGAYLGHLIRNCPPHRRNSRVTRRRVRRGTASTWGARSDSHASVGPREAWEHIASCGAPTTDLLMRLCGVPPAHLSNFYETAECSAKERRVAKEPQPSGARRRPAQPQAAHQSSNLGSAVKGATPLLCQPRASQPTRMDKTA